MGVACGSAATMNEEQLFKIADAQKIVRLVETKNNNINKLILFLS
jgi:hypothetical protein